MRYITRQQIKRLIVDKKMLMAELMVYFDKKCGGQRLDKWIRENNNPYHKKYKKHIEYSGLLNQ
mgnify:CR=1 FL=1